MSTSPDMHPLANAEPVSAEVERVTDQPHELDRLRIFEKSLTAASRAEGAAQVAVGTVNVLRDEHGGKIAVLEDFRRTIESDVKEINAKLNGIERAMTVMATRSPYQQALYALTALAALGYFATLLFDRFIGAGAG